MFTNILKSVYKIIVKILKCLLFFFILIFWGEDIFGLFSLKMFSFQTILFIILSFGLIIYFYFILFKKHKFIDYLYYIIAWISLIILTRNLPDMLKYYDFSIF